MAKIVVEDGQNLTDVSVMLGGIERIFEIVENNPELENITSDLYPGQIISLDKPADKDKRLLELYNFFQNRKIRVKTGNEYNEVLTICAIPEGYTLFEFTINSIDSGTVLYLNFGQECPTWDAFYAQLMSEYPMDSIYPSTSINLNLYLSLINFHYGSIPLSPQSAAAEFAAWFNNVSNLQGYAVSVDATISVYLPTSIYPCGTPAHICTFEQIRYYKQGGREGFENLFQDGGNADIGYANDGLTKCC